MIINGEGRFVLLSKPVSHPFSDIVTGTPEGPVFDLSVDLEYYSGVAYLKAEHVEEMAKTLGMLTKGEADELRVKMSQLEAEKNALPAHVESLLSGINACIDSYAGNSGAGIDRSVPVYLLDPAPESESTSIETSGKAGPDPVDKPSRKVDKPSVDKGPAKLSAGSDDGFEF